MDCPGRAGARHRRRRCVSADRPQSRSFGAAVGRRSGQVRTYFIAADEVAWDYAPSGQNQSPGSRSQMPFENLWSRCGQRTASAACTRRPSTASTPTQRSRTLKPRAPDWEHLGILGPLIRAEVGDTIQVVFKNNGEPPVQHASARRLLQEGVRRRAVRRRHAAANSGRRRAAGRDAHLCLAGARAGRARTGHEGSSVIWMYHSHTTRNLDVNAGLIGPMVVTRPRRRPTRRLRRRTSIASSWSRFGEFDENFSWHFDETKHPKRYSASRCRKELMDNFADPVYLDQPEGNASTASSTATCQG